MNTITEQCFPRMGKQKARCSALLSAIALLLGSAISPVYAQLVNGDFESNCGTSAFGAFQVSLNGCVTGPWFVSHGTPDIEYNIGGNATAAAYMWASSNRGEGLFVECPVFEEDRTYTMTFRYHTHDSPDEINIALSNTLAHNNNTSNFTHPTVSRQIIWSLPNPANLTWTTVSFTFVPDQDYSQLWIYPRESSTAWSVLHIDDVEIVRDCPAQVVYTSFSGTPDRTYAADNIQAYGTSAVSAAQEITYRAGNYIQLLPEFHAAPGSGFFHAYIAPCDDMQSCEDNGILGKRGDGRGLPDDRRMMGMMEVLVGNYPNPFNGKTMISYTLPASGPVTLVITNMLGEQVAELIQGSYYNAGQYSTEFDGSGLSPGVYFITLQSGTTSTTRKMVISP